MNLRDQLTSVENQLAEEKSNLDKNPELIAQLELKQAQLTAQISEQEAVQQERIQVQEEKVESIVLPYDFNEIFDDPRANDMIIELIKDNKRQSYAEHNAEVETLISEHKAEVAHLVNENTAVVTESKRIESDMESLSKIVSSLRNEIFLVEQERDDAISKRDAAVRRAEAAEADAKGLETLLEEKQAHIDKLRDEIALGARAAINVTNIAGSNRLAELVQESKSAKIKSALEIALERTEPIRGKVEVVAPPKALEEATFPAQASNSANIGLDNESAGQLPAANSEVGFPVVPTAEAPNISGEVSVVVSAPELSGQGQISREEFESRIRQVKEEIKAEIVSQYGLVKLAS